MSVAAYLRNTLRNLTSGPMTMKVLEEEEER